MYLIGDITKLMTASAKGKMSHQSNNNKSVDIGNIITITKAMINDVRIKLNNLQKNIIKDFDHLVDEDQELTTMLQIAINGCLDLYNSVKDDGFLTDDAFALKESIDDMKELLNDILIHKDKSFMNSLKELENSY